MAKHMTTKKKRTTAIVAAACAVFIALSGTFAWQSISQQALNEAKGISNPGGRLHDDYSGPDGNKDVYVENFGDQDIFARVRLDEYMEIGKGAGEKGTYDEATNTWIANENNKATSLVNGANINDVTTWTTHLPGSVDADISTGDYPAGTQFADASQTFHNYFTWTMGGEGDNEGQTVYMPTFNMNKDSLAADINGTLEGKNGVAYADYVEYTDGQVVSGTVYEDADDNTVDEGKGTGKGNGGTEGVNYNAIQDQSHTAKKTLTASVITMNTYNAMSDEDKDAFAGWVYDADGWAYWSQPIKKGTATGLLLDKVSTKDKADEWYYGINVVAQFVTANDLGKTGENATGFFADGGQMPSDDALALLARAGVNTKGITLTANDTHENVSGIITVVPGTDGYSMSVTATAATEVTNWVWSSNNTAVASVSTSGETNEIGTVKVPNTAEAGGSAIITVTAKNNQETIGSTTFTVKVGAYLVTVENTDDAKVDTTGITFNAKSTAPNGTDATNAEGAAWSWTVSGDDAASFTIENANTAAATVKAADGATPGVTATVTATYTGTDGATASYSFDVAVAGAE